MTDHTTDRYRALFETLHLGIVYQHADGSIVDCNPAAERILGLTRAQIEGRTSFDPRWHAMREDGSAFPGDEHPAMVALRTGHPVRGVLMGVYHPTTDSLHWILIDAYPEFMPGQTQPFRVFAVFSDVTEQRRVQEELRQRGERQALSVEVLGILNDTHTTTDAAVRILTAIRRMTGFDAVGIRLRSGDDFPYAATAGFTADFVAAENHLAARRPDGEFCRDEAGRINLECTCGLVLQGRTDPANPLFTPNGSAWVNRSEALLALHPSDDPRLHPRNRCIHAGYRSVALIPIRIADETVGLLQLNDRRPDRLDLEMVQFFEGVAASVGVALARSRATEALRESEANLRTLFDAIPESVFLMDAGGTVLAANETFASRLGVRPEQSRGLDVFSALPAEVAQRRRPWLDEVVATGTRVVRTDRRGDRWTEHHLNPIADGNGVVNRVVTLGIDVTERRRLAATLETEQTRLQLALEAARAGAFDWDLTTNVAHGTPALFELFGLPAGGPLRDVPGAWRATVHPDDLRRTQEAVQRSFESGLFAEEFRVVRPDGAVRWLSSRAKVSVGEDGHPTRMVGITLDVTERQRMERALRDSEERYRHLVETAFDWVWEVDSDARYTYSSAHVRDVLGYDPEDVLGRTPFDFMPAEEAVRMREVFRDYADRRAPLVAVTNANRHRDGSTVILETSGVPVFGEDGAFRGYRGMDRDVTSRRRLEEQLRQAQKLEAIGQLAGGVAHDFNNILAGTMMQLGLLQDNPLLDDEMRQALQEMEAEAQRAAGLTRQLLMFSRRSVLDVRSLNLSDVVTNLLRMLRRLIGEHVELRFDTQTTLPTVQADAGMIEQVLMNLVVNARDAMPRGGRITIATTSAELSRAEATAHSSRRPGRFVCLAVTDTGVGMSAATRQRIFEPFFTTKEAGRGTGLGLATVHGIVAQHGGWIEVDSTEGQGTAFRVYLPAHDAPVEPEDVESRERPKRGRETVLLAEDDASVRRMIALTLSELGYQVIEAASGLEALNLWQSCGRTVDLVFTDMVMPEGVTGLELVERLQQIKPGLRAIISSGYSGEMVQSGVPTRDGVLFLPKPYDARTLGRTVRDWLDRVN